MAGGLVSVLLWIGGYSTGAPVARLRRAIVRLWIALAACICGLGLVRLGLHGGVFDLDFAHSAPLRLRPLNSRNLALVVAGLLWTAAWLLFAVRAARTVTSRMPPNEAKQEE